MVKDVFKKAIAVSSTFVLFIYDCIKAISSLLAIMIVLFIGIIAGTAFGALGGWIIGLVFTDTITIIGAKLFGFTEPWEIGAALGFIGSFFKTNTFKD